MSEVQKRYDIIGTTPLLMHSAALANPRNEHAKALKKISGKRKKTDEDFEEMARIEFMGSIYFEQRKGFVIPGEVWEAALLASAKKNKQGPLVKAGVFVRQSSALDADGPKTPEERWEDPNCVDMRAVRVQTSRLMRTRPIFKNWSTSVVVTFDPEIVDEETLDEIMSRAGSQIGICDYRPRYGRFEVA